MRGFVVTGTDTGVGKTVVSAAILHLLRHRHPGVPLHYRKLVQTGWPRDDDARTVRRLTGLSREHAPPAPVRLRSPASPYEAALAERRRLAPGQIGSRIRDLDGFVVAEGAGGLLVPLSPRSVLADRFAALGMPLLVVARPEVGTVNHTLLTLGEARRRGLAVAGVVFSRPPTDVVRTCVRSLGKLREVAVLPRFSPLDRATLAGAVPELLRRGPIARLIERLYA